MPNSDPRSLGSLGSGRGSLSNLMSPPLGNPPSPVLSADFLPGKKMSTVPHGCVCRCRRERRCAWEALRSAPALQRVRQAQPARPPSGRGALAAPPTAFAQIFRCAQNICSQPSGSTQRAGLTPSWLRLVAVAAAACAEAEKPGEQGPGGGAAGQEGGQGREEGRLAARRQAHLEGLRLAKCEPRTHCSSCIALADYRPTFHTQ